MAPRGGVRDEVARTLRVSAVSRGRLIIAVALHIGRTARPTSAFVLALWLHELFVIHNLLSIQSLVELANGKS
eukprot:scaffold56033_cov23-Prasinocladus_malaysianus.AAC.2